MQHRWQMFRKRLTFSRGAGEEGADEKRRELPPCLKTSRETRAADIRTENKTIAQCSVMEEKGRQTALFAPSVIISNTYLNYRPAQGLSEICTNSTTLMNFQAVHLAHFCRHLLYIAYKMSLSVYYLCHII